MRERNTTVDGIGYSAGIILSICLIPQIYKMCGNSVSVPVIEMIYQKVLSYL